jgi:hypothetical protein
MVWQALASHELKVSAAARAEHHVCVMAANVHRLAAVTCASAAADTCARMCKISHMDRYTQAADSVHFACAV